MSADPCLDDFLDVRERLLAVAHHYAGGVVDAEDIVQDAWMRWQRTDRTVVQNPPAFLCRTTARLSIDAIRSTLRHSTVPTGPWLERIGEPNADPARYAEQADDIRWAIRRLTAVLAPRERVVYILREAFGWPYRQIGAALGVTEEHARQLARRARLALSSTGHSDVPGVPGERVRLLSAFLTASRTGDVRGLVAIADDVTRMVTRTRA